MDLAEQITAVATNLAVVMFAAPKTWRAVALGK